jgi:hypothetical protein
VRYYLSNLQSLFPEGAALSEDAELGMTRGEEGERLHIGQSGLTEALTTLWAVEGCHGLSETVDRPPIASLGPVCCAKVEVRQRLYDGVPAGGRER